MIETRITPTIARTYLAQNTGNRKLRKSHVELLARSMADGEWDHRGSATIKISEEGKLIDGQHRLHAVILSGASVIMRVETGVPESVFTLIDTGLPRRNSDFFAFRGHTKHQNVIAAASNIAYALHFGIQRLGTKVPFYKALKIADGYDIYGSVEFVTGHREYLRATAQVVSTSVLSGVHAVLKSVDPQKADEFIRGYIVGDNLDANNPILVYRNRIQQMRLSHTHSLPQKVLIHMLVKSWNLWFNGETCERANVRADSERPAISGFTQVDITLSDLPSENSAPPLPQDTEQCEQREEPTLRHE